MKENYPRSRQNKKLLERPVDRELLEVINQHYLILKHDLCGDCRCYGGITAEDVLHDTIERVIRESCLPDEVVEKIKERFNMIMYQTIHDHRSRMKHNKYANDIQAEEE